MHSQEELNMVGFLQCSFKSLAQAYNSNSAMNTPTSSKKSLPLISPNPKIKSKAESNDKKSQEALRIVEKKENKSVPYPKELYKKKFHCFLPYKRMIKRKTQSLPSLFVKKDSPYPHNKFSSNSAKALFSISKSSHPRRKISLVPITKWKSSMTMINEFSKANSPKVDKTLFAFKSAKSFIESSVSDSLKKLLPTSVPSICSSIFPTCGNSAQKKLCWNLDPPKNSCQQLLHATSFKSMVSLHFVLIYFSNLH